MALKPRVARTPGDVAKVSPDEPLAIDLGKQDPEPRDIIYGKQDARNISVTSPSGSQPQASPSPTPPAPPQEEDDGPSLEKQLAQIRLSEEQAKARAAQAEADRQAMWQQAQRHQQEIGQLRSQTDGAHHDTLVNAIAAAQADAESAQNQYAASLASQDHAAAAEAQRRMMRAEARIVQLEAGKDELERRIQQAPQPQMQQQPTPLPSPNMIEQVLASMPGLIQQERDYLRKHPDAVLDPVNQRRLEVAFLDAQQRGIQRGTDDYFKLFDDRLGYQSSPREEEPMADEPTAMVAAPVSRSVPGTSRESDTRIILSPAQREAARWAGVDEFTYARGLQKLRQAKRDDKEKYGS